MPTTRDRRSSRWDTHRRERRAALVDAAIVAIRKHGAGVGMDDVAAQAATSKTVVYRHFADRADLYTAVCGRVADVLLAQIGAAMAAAEGPRETAAAGIETYLRLVEADPEVHRFVVHRPHTGGDPVADIVTLLGEQATEVIAEQLARTGGDVSAAVAWGHGIVGMVHAAADRWLSGAARDGGPAMRRDALAAHLTRLAWGGLSGMATVPTATAPGPTTTSQEDS